MDISSLESEIFPTVEELVNYTSQFNSAQIIIPAEVLLEALASEGNSHTTCNAQYVSIISSFGMQLHEFKRRELSLVVMLITLLNLCACKCCEFSCMVIRCLCTNMLPATIIHLQEVFQLPTSSSKTWRTFFLAQWMD